MYGKIKYIDFTTASLKNDLEFRYDPMGNRTMKIEYASTGAKYTFYSRDAQGNPMTTYEQDYNLETDLYLSDFSIYGSSRLGVKKVDEKLAQITFNSYFSRDLGKKMYELSNHLGNVLTTVSDIKLTADGNTDGVVDSYAAVITSAQDYYPFGSLEMDRTYSSENYRFGFNGQEMDNEITGQPGTHTTAMFWEYDARLGRRWNVDPVVKYWQSSYICFSDNPILKIDPNGDDDFFDSEGNYLGSSCEGTAIRIVNDGFTFEIALADENVSTLITDLDYCNEFTNNRNMLLNVAKYYGNTLSISKSFEIYDILDEKNLDAAMAYSRTKRVYSIVVNGYTGKINSSLNHIYNFINSLAHEKDHETNPLAGTPMGEIDAIVAESSHDSWGKTTSNYKQASVSYALSNINKMVENGMEESEIEKWVNKFNNSKAGDVGFIFKNDTSGKYERTVLLPAVEIKPE